MFDIRIAELNIRIHNRFPFVENLCRKYTIPAVDHPNMEVSVGDKEIEAERAIVAHPVTRDYAEAVCIYRELCKRLPKEQNAFLLHSAVIEYRGHGYAFSAKSGTGKSTHISLWQKEFGDEVRIINGDKPIMKFTDQGLIAYGTPWCGKENLSLNDSVPLTALCFLERGDINRIRQIPPEDAVLRIVHQILTPDDMETLDALFPLLDRMLAEIPCYLLQCNMETEAARVAFSAMNPDSNENKRRLE